MKELELHVLTKVLDALPVLPTRSLRAATLDPQSFDKREGGLLQHLQKQPQA